MNKKAGPVKTGPGSVLEHAHEKNIFSATLLFETKSGRNPDFFYDLTYSMKRFSQNRNIHTPTSFYYDKWQHAITGKAAVEQKKESC